MNVLLLIPITIILIGVATYPKWSYKEFGKRCEVNSKHPDWKPYCGINFIKKDPQWFLDNGYGKYVNYSDIE